MFAAKSLKKSTASSPSVQKQTQRKLRPSRVLLYAILLLWTVVVFFPLYWVLITSFKLPVDVARGSLIPWVDFQPSATTWIDILSGPQSGQVSRAYINSLSISISSAFVATILGAMAGYGLNRFRYKVLWMRNEGLAFWFISQRMLPPVAVVLAYLLLYRDLRLLDTQFGLALAYVGFSLPLVVWIMRDFFTKIPREIEESAAIDGASRWLIFWRIAMPLALPGLVASFLLSLVFSFNEYLFGLVLTSRQSTTFPIMLASQVTGDSIRFWMLSALALMNVIPAAIVMIILERFITRGLLAGSVK